MYKQNRNRYSLLLLLWILCYNTGMSTIQITLPEPLQRFVQGRVAELGLDQPDQYIEQLLEEEQHRRLEEYYMEECRKGLESGPLIPVTPGFWDAIADEAVRKCQERKRKVAQ